ncbi:MAG: peptide-methionine (S)-S-oxide reductase MsrA [Saprospiraceae bacterium]
MPVTPNLEIAVFACGCFWSKEYFFQRQVGVVATRVGYTGGHTKNPTYVEVCKKQSGHAEAVELSFDPTKTSFEKLMHAFFDIHDAQINRSTKGGQYRSAIFYTNPQQKNIATRYKEKLLNSGHPIHTEIEAASSFWPAESRHQKYCDRTGLHPGTKYDKIR